MTAIQIQKKYYERNAPHYMTTQSTNKRSFKKSKDASRAFGKKKRLEELEKNECRWPIGDPQDPDFHFCGAKCEVGSYCARHAEIAYVKRQE